MHLCPQHLVGLFALTYCSAGITSSKDGDIITTYYKVGKTTKTAKERIYGQTKTAHPEPPHILRVYELKENGEDEDAFANRLDTTETEIHNHLFLAGHKESKIEGTGKEWFITNIQFLDDIAQMIGLEIYGE